MAENAVSESSTIDFNVFLPEGETLFPYQQAGVANAIVRRRLLLADEQGLGKTRQALIAAEALNAFPMVVVCPASLRRNWEREVERCLPGRSVQVLLGSTPYETYADVLVISYNLLSVWAEALEPITLVLDESHFVKEAKSQRTKAAKALARRVPADGLVLLLTGTPMLNRPIELITQLQILGRLVEVAPKPKYGTTERDYEFAFKNTYAYSGERNGHAEYKGARNLDRLNEILRSTVMVRRERKDVLGMNDTHRIEIPLSLNGKLAEYRKAERAFIQWVAANGGPEAVEAARKAEVLTQMNALRKLAGTAKIEATVEWVQDFFNQNEGRSLVVFAWHVEVQKALVAAFPGCSQILASQGDVEEQKARFLNGETKLIVCSINAASTGHTLVGPNIECQDVLFIEQGWNPGTMSQCEDRINRIGQQASQVFAWNLLAEDTIDEDMAAMIETKRTAVQAAIVGKPLPEGDEGTVQSAVLRRIAGKG